MARLSVPALAISIADDAFAPEIAVRRFLMGLPNAPVVRRVLGAHEGAAAIGHFGLFRRIHRRYWTIVSRFLGSNGVAHGFASSGASKRLPIRTPDAVRVERRSGAAPRRTDEG
jgi:hypothetical protein